MSLEEELEKKVDKYQKLTEKALNLVKLNEKLNTEQKLIAEDFLSMTRNYLNDGKYYREKKELLIALASFSYAHAWLDAGVRAKIFYAKDDQLFTLP
ncbi:MAG: DUF357 domain-containing protein [Candidatus ainarchaeum sp.]|jgi:hypothetical protein|nr:DUF357 domain-containing protein [Candidatus ainarchaeum sp.]MDD3085620.1 DUF357 domain-containing protein [Candidatus ainarchaeum sp.]MDD4128422.1 DUF357 domain-containing protein [Candidatus ainarchaeum sp.]MDD4467677.1 DUF357 domain-containing protein [Candidatus ainarchaeum sp.]HPM85495.1 DUF357 domain-containing protein [archaeon]